MYIYIYDEGSLLPKYRDCTTSNDFELYLMCCGVMLQKTYYMYIYIYIFLYVYIYIYIHTEIHHCYKSSNIPNTEMVGFTSIL